MWNDILLLFIGSILTLLPILLEKTFNFIGSIKFHSKFIFGLTTQSKAFVIENGNENVLNVPMKIEIINNKNKEVIIRNLSISLFKGNKKIADMYQADYSIIDNKGVKEKLEYGENKSYSFVLAPKSLKTLHCYFFIKQNSDNLEYDNLKLSYYNGEKQVFLDLIDNIQSWKTIQNLPESWIVNKKSKINKLKQAKMKTN